MECWVNADKEEIVCEEVEDGSKIIKRLFRKGDKVCVERKGMDKWESTVCISGKLFVKLFEEDLRSCIEASEKGEQELLNEIAKDAMDKIELFPEVNIILSPEDVREIFGYDIDDL